MSGKDGFMRQTMRAAVLTGPSRIETVEAPLPEPGPGELRVRLEGCGVCASNVEPWAGQPWSTYPGEPGGMGHEGWGIVDSLGFVEIVEEVEARYAVGVQDVEITEENFGSVDAISRYVERKRAEP